jgi:hypothetical protein
LLGCFRKSLVLKLEPEFVLLELEAAGFVFFVAFAQKLSEN